MSYCRTRFLFLCSLLTLAGSHILAQTSSVSNPYSGHENNPYTKYGIGELRNGDNTAIKAMGSITSAYSSPLQINTDNPASYSSLLRTTYEVGGFAQTRNVTGTADNVPLSYTTGTASAAYMRFAVPVGRKGGLCFGFRPVSHVFYSLVDTLAVNFGGGSHTDTSIKSYNADGSLNYAFIGGSVKVAQGLSLGANVGFLFGTIRSSSLLIPNTNVLVPPVYAYRSEFSRYTRTGGVYWKVGAQYELKLDSMNTLHFGATFSLNQKLTQHFSEYHISSFVFSDTIPRDTAYSISEAKGKLTMPTSYSAGVMLTHGARWSVGIDYTATRWSEFHSDLNPYMNVGIASSAYRIAAGGGFTPDATNGKRYLARGTYKLGAFYGTEYIAPNNTTLPNYGVTAGFTLPFKRSLSQVHTAFEFGTLGTTANGLMKQNYFRFSVGLSLNDLWFVKRRLD